jgi:hypothetical protein
MKSGRSGTPCRRLFGAAYVAMAGLGLFGAPKAAYSDQWLQDGREPPLYPSIITTVYQGKTYPIIGASAEFAEIMVEGKEVRLHSDQRFQTPRAVGFAPGHVRVEGQDAESITRTNSTRWLMTADGVTNPTYPSSLPAKSGTYQCTLVASEPHVNCFLAVIFYCNDESGVPDPASTTVAFRQVGSLFPGRPIQVTINESYKAAAGKKFFFFPLVYSLGREIRSDYCETSARFFRLSEMASHQAILAQYRQQNPSADKPASAYLRFQPEFPDGFDMHVLPAVVTAKFAVTETGEVDSVELDQVLGDEAGHAIRRALEGWLFLPRLKGGYPVRTMITVPLSFSPG